MILARLPALPILPVLTLALTSLSPRTAVAQDTAAARAAPVSAVRSARPALRAVRISGAPPTIDGRLDEPSWRSAPMATDFVQQRPMPGAPATRRTEARVLYDDQALYVGMRMYDPDRARIAATVARRDYTGYSDWAQVLIDSYHDRRTAFRFGVNPAGVQKDVLEYNDANGEDVGWDAVWQAATNIDSLGWTAEFRIPFSQLRFSSARAPRATSPEGRIWGIDFLRDIASLNERDYWAPIPPAGPGFVSLFGDLTGLVDLASPRRLEVLPYARASVTRAPGESADPFFHATDAAGKVGADLKYGLTSDLTLTATLNPDFGQVEADPSVVNLTAFETFFEEKRPFFTEGSDIFRFDIGFPYSVRGNSFTNDQPFYSRRIGRQPQGVLPDAAVFEDVPSETTILGAAKVSGKTAGGWSIGLLDALTQREKARYTDAAGDRLTIPVEPLTNFGVARVLRDFRDGQSAAGAMITATDRRIDGTGLDALRSTAYAAGLDGRHRFGGGNYEVTASVLGTYLEGSPAAIALVQRAPGHYFQRPDAAYAGYDTARTTLAGYAASAQLSKIGGHWRGWLVGHARSLGFDMNDLGFSRTADWLLGGAYLGYVQFQPSRFARDWSLNANAWSGWSYGGERRTTGVNLNGSIDFPSNWGASFSVDREFGALSMDALRGGPALAVPAYISPQVSVFSDARKRLSGQLTVNGFQESETGGWSLDVTPTVSVRAGGRAELSVAPEVAWTYNPWQYVTTATALGEPHYVFGRIRQTTTSLTARASYSFTPTLSLQLYGQPFISAGRYGTFRQVVDLRAPRFAERFHIYSPSELSYSDSTGTYAADLNGDGAGDLVFANPDFDVKEFRSTTVLRWEYRPGSTLFVVWSQGRSLDTAGDGSFALGRDVHRLFGAPPTDVLLVKVNYWLSW